MQSYQTGQKPADFDRRRPHWATPMISAARLMNSQGEVQSAFPLGADITIEIAYDTGGETTLRSPVMGVIVHHALLGAVGGVNTRMTGFEPDCTKSQKGLIRCTLKRPPLLPGEYLIDVWLGDGPADVDTVAGALNLILEPTDVYGSGRTPFAHLGTMYFDPVWHFEEACR
jgi:hypothetical protein